MFLLYSFLLSLGFLLMSPFFLFRREKYASGFRQRLGNYPEFKHDQRRVIWLHCVSVGETNAARPLVDRLLEEFPDHRLVISTTTKTGQELAQKIFADKGDAVVYFPFDWKFSVRRALRNYNPSLVLLMETEIWPRFIREAKLTGAKVVIVNGRVSERSFARYRRVRTFIAHVLSEVDLALMQADKDAARLIDLGMDRAKVSVTGNLKFEQVASASDGELTEYFRRRFAISPDKPLIIAASTHEPEERYVIESLADQLGHSCRLMLVPRHPERFDVVEKLLRDLPYIGVRRTAAESDADQDADVILLDTIGELRAAYPLAEIVFVGGSLVPHGGQSILEPAVEGKAIVTGPYTSNFDGVVKEFLENDAIRQTLPAQDARAITEQLHQQFVQLLDNKTAREQLGRDAAAVMVRSNQNAAADTVRRLKLLNSSPE